MAVRECGGSWVCGCGCGWVGGGRLGRRWKGEGEVGREEERTGAWVWSVEVVRWEGRGKGGCVWCVWVCLGV